MKGFDKYKQQLEDMDIESGGQKLNYSQLIYWNIFNISKVGAIVQMSKGANYDEAVQVYYQSIEMLETLLIPYLDDIYESDMKIADMRKDDAIQYLKLKMRALMNLMRRLGFLLEDTGESIEGTEPYIKTGDEW